MISPIHFLFSNIFISLLLGILLLFKKIFRKHMTVSVQYHIWYVFVGILFLPFFPYRALITQRFLSWIYSLFAAGPSAGSSAVSSGETAAVISQETIRDFSAALDSSGSLLPKFLLFLWIFGMTATALYFVGTMLRIHFIRKRAYLITAQSEPDLYRQFSDCLRELSLKRTVKMYASCHIESPVSYGFLFPKIIIPQDLDIVSSNEELRFIFLHELQHHKHHDALLNLLVCILEALYWFNPFIWFGFSQLQKDREIACDHSVINIIGTENSLPYGIAIIKFAQNMQKGLFLSPLSNMGGCKKTAKQRIIKIAEYKMESSRQKLKSLAVSFLLILLMFCSVPLLNAYASGSAPMHIAKEQWTPLDASRYFNGKDGSFVLYDMKSEQYFIYNKEKSEQRIPPESTYKIYSGLFALEEQLISPDSNVLAWNKSSQPFDSWMQDQTLESAMQNSVNWYFQSLDKQMGFWSLSSYYNNISCGNCDLSGGIETYWSESSLKISPVEQVRLLSGLLENAWGFQPENIRAIKQAMFLSEDSSRHTRLYGKTGTGVAGGQRQNGWFVGFLETSQSSYCFAANIQGIGSCDGSAAAEITLSILDELFSF